MPEKSFEAMKTLHLRVTKKLQASKSAIDIDSFIENILMYLIIKFIKNLLLI